MPQLDFNPLFNRSRLPPVQVVDHGGVPALRITSAGRPLQVVDVALPAGVPGRLRRKTVPLAERRLSALPVATARGEAAENTRKLHRLTETLEASRGEPLASQPPGARGPLTRVGQCMHAQLLQIGEALALLARGPSARPGAIAALQCLDGHAAQLGKGMRATLKAWHAAHPDSSRFVLVDGGSSHSDRSSGSASLRAHAGTATATASASDSVHEAAARGREGVALSLDDTADDDEDWTDASGDLPDDDAGRATSSRSSIPGRDPASGHAGAQAGSELERINAVLREAVARVKRDARVPGESPVDPPVEALDELVRLTQAVLGQIEDRRRYVAMVASQGPRSVSHMYTGKASLCRAAVAAVEDRLRPRHLPNGKRVAGLPAREAAPLRRVARKLKQRAEALEVEAQRRDGEQGDPRAIEGRPPVAGFFNRLLRLPTVLRQRLALRRWVDRLTNPRAADQPRPPLETPEIDEQTILETALAHAYREAGLPPEQAIGDFRAALARHFAQQRWAPIDTEIQVQVGPQTVFARSEIRPAVALGAAERGVSSLDATQDQRAVNAAMTTLTDARGKVLYQGWRHGAVSAWGLTPEAIRRTGMSDERLAAHVERLEPSALVLGASDLVNVARTAEQARSDPQQLARMRQAANANRVDDLLTHMVLADPVYYRPAAALPFAGPGEHAPVPPRLSVLAISLYSPGQGDAEPDEGLLLADHRAAWLDARGDRQLGTDDTPLNVQVEAVLFNHAVPAAPSRGDDRPSVAPGSHEAAALERLLGRQSPEIEADRILLESSRATAARLRAERASLASRPLSAEPARHREREVELELLDAGIADARDKERQLEQKLALVDALGAQITALAARGPDRDDPYALPARLALLGHLLGMEVAISCATGHDRTSELDAEVKHLALELELTGRLPPIDAPAWPDVQARRRAVFDGSGNDELRRLNTGYADYRHQGVAEVP